MRDEYRLLTGYRENDRLRGAFNALAGNVFGLDFEPWYRRGLWTDQYVPFTLFDGDKAVSNVSANRFDLLLDGVPKKAIQFGTVMTDPAYRNKGLARRLLQHAMDTLRAECELFYLMGDKDAAGFYRKFGFAGIQESTFTLQLNPASDLGPANPGTGRFLDPGTEEDMRILLEAAAMRLPVSRQVGVYDAGYLLAFYAMNGFASRFYWHQGEVGKLLSGSDIRPLSFMKGDFLVVFHEEAGILHLHDVIRNCDLSMREVLSVLPHGPVNEVSFGFTPDCLDMDFGIGTLAVAPLENEDTFFVLSDSGFAASPFLYPPVALA